MGKKKSEDAPLLLRLDFFPMFRALDERGMHAWFNAVMDYRTDGVIPDLSGESSLVRGAFDKDLEKYEEKCRINQINGRKGGEAKAANSSMNEQAEVEAGGKEDNEQESERVSSATPTDVGVLFNSEAGKAYGGGDDDLPF